MGVVMNLSVLRERHTERPPARFVDVEAADVAAELVAADRQPGRLYHLAFFGLMVVSQNEHARPIRFVATVRVLAHAVAAHSERWAVALLPFVPPRQAHPHRRAGLPGH